MSDQSANVNLQSGIQSALFNLQSAILAAACLVAAPPLQASGLTAPEPLAKAYDLILDARFDEADQQLKQACGPAPQVGCDVLRVVSLYWQLLFDPDAVGDGHRTAHQSPEHHLLGPPIPQSGLEVDVLRGHVLT